MDNSELSDEEKELARKRDALALAQLIYDIYREKQTSPDLESSENL